MRDLQTEDEYFVGTCSHVGESKEIDDCSSARMPYLKAMRLRGLTVKVALLNGEHAGFIYLSPCEVSPWGPIAPGFMMIYCLYVVEKGKGHCIGETMIKKAEEEAMLRDMRGLVTYAYYGLDWFMPASYFEKLGFECVDRKGKRGLFWRPFASGTEKPALPDERYVYKPVEGKAVVDLFWNLLCPTSAIEAARVTNVAREFGDRVVLNDHCSLDLDSFAEHCLPRAIYVNGTEIGWGYEAPEDGIRKAIVDALGSGP